MSASRLSSLLVRDGVLTVKRMEQAFQRQVIYGGTLDTIMLEMGAVPEQRLWHYLSLATGLPAADRDLLEYFDPRAVQICPREMAEKHHVAPCALDGPALRCLVIDPVDLGQLEALATELGVPVQPFVVPEFRYHTHLERLFGIPTPARFAALARKLTYVPTSGREEPSVLSEGPRAPAPATTQEFGSGSHAPPPREPVAAAAAAPQAPQAHSTLPGGLGVGSTSDAPRAQPTEITMDADEPEVLAPPPVAPPIEKPRRARMPDGPPDPRARAAARGTIDPPAERPAPRMPSASVIMDAAALRVEPHPLEPREARTALAKADDRDEVFALLARAVRARARYVAVLSIGNGLATGRLGIDGDSVDDVVPTLTLPLDKHAPLRGAVASRSPYFGPVGSTDPDVDVTWRRLGGVIPAAALILPVSIKDRTVAVVYAHRGADAFAIADVADVLPVAGEAASALLRILAARSAARKPPAPTPTMLPQTIVSEAPPPPRAQTPPPIAGPPSPVTAALTSTIGSYGAPRSMQQLLDAVEADDDLLGTRAADEALTRPDELIAALGARFPGHLRVDRYATGGRALRAPQHGALLGLCLRAGTRVVPMLVEKLASPDREIRYYATLVLAELRAPLAVPGLVKQVFDPDYGVRGAAIEALAGYPSRDLDDALEPLRRALRQGGDPIRTRAAAHALGELRDVKAVLELIDVIDRRDPAATEAHHALVAITKQDFAMKVRRWREWFTAERGRHRVEWMIDGLSHPDEPVRRSAGDELMRLTGEHFGFHPDAARRDREDAAGRWRDWWRETGRKRFV